MSEKERLETIKEFVKKIESILYDEWRQQELTILIESLYYDDHVDWLIEQAEKAEQLQQENEQLKKLLNWEQEEIERLEKRYEFASQIEYELRQEIQQLQRQLQKVHGG